MGKFTVGNGQYVIYAKDSEQARQVISQELQRVDKIREKMAQSQILWDLGFRS